MKKYATLAVFVFFFLLYAVTAQRGLSWQDGGEYQWRILSGDAVGFAGLARAHPLYIYAARAWSLCFPRSMELWATSLFSGAGAAVALTLLFATIRRATASVTAAAITVTLAGFGHMFWWMASVAEVYTWSVAMLALELYLLLTASGGGRRATPVLFALFLVNGVHFCIHNFALLDLAVLAPAAAVLSLKRDKRISALLRTALLSALGWFAGSFLIWVLFFEGMRDGLSLQSAIEGLLFGDGYERAVLGKAGFKRGVFLCNMALAAISFANPLWAGLFARRTERSRPEEGPGRFFLVTVSALTALHFVFWIRYFVADQATFVLPTFFLLAVLAGFGYGRASFAKWHAVQLTALGALTAVFVPLIAAQALQVKSFGISRARTLPYRNEFSYWLLPWKFNEDSAERFVRQSATIAGEGDLVIADTTVSGTLQAAALSGRFPEACAVLPVYEYRNGAKLPELLKQYDNVYLVSPVAGYTPDDSVFLSERYRYVRKNTLYRISDAAGGESERKEVAE